MASTKPWADRTRGNFRNDGIDVFRNIAINGASIVDCVVLDMLDSRIDAESLEWPIALRQVARRDLLALLHGDLPKPHLPDLQVPSALT